MCIETATVEMAQDSIKELKESYWDFPSKDPYIDSLFLMRSPVPLMLIIVAYFLMVTIGPLLMKNRPPMNLKKMMILYNVTQIAMATNLSHMIVTKLHMFQDGLLLAGCRYSFESKDPMLLYGTWLYFFTKVTELLDTVFFVLRKKNGQVTFLHVYHHAFMVIYMWSYLKYAAAGDGATLAFFNCVVHIVMYSYYLLAGLGPGVQKYLRWKKFITKMQLIQFIVMLLFNINWAYFQPQCRFSTTYMGLTTANIIIFIGLFINFYYKSYKQKE